MLATTRIHHVSLSVTDLDRAAAWWTRVLGFEEVERMRGEHRDRVRLRHEGNGLRLALTCHHDHHGGRFDPRSTGMDHLALGVPGVAELEAWVAHLDELGIDHPPVRRPRMGWGPGAVVSVWDPDGIHVELFADGP